MEAFMLKKTRHSSQVQSVLVTGASRGIGSAFARALPQDCRIILTGRDQDALDRVRDEITLPGREVSIVTADLALAADRSRVIEKGLAADLDMVIANAGTGNYGRFLDRELSQHQTTLSVNVEAVVELLHSLLPGMIKRAKINQRRAAAIVVGSTAGFVPVPYLATYAASKAFVLSFCESLSAELSADPVDILCVCPGATETEFGSRAGFSGGSPPGAMEPDFVARKALRAVGRRRTLMLDPVPAPVLAPTALLRATAAEIMRRAIDVFDRGRSR